MTQNVIRSATNVAQEERNKLDRRIQAQLLATVQDEERIVSERAEHQRLEAAAEQRTRAVDLFQRNKETIAAMMIQFDTLISEGVYNVLVNGGMAIFPWRQLRSSRRSCWPRRPMRFSEVARCPTAITTRRPFAGRVRLQFHGFHGARNCSSASWSQYRFLLTMQDVRAPHPLPRHPDDRVSRRRLVAAPCPRSGSSGTARPSICSTAIPRPSRSSRSSTSRSRCRSPTRPRSTTS